MQKNENTKQKQYPLTNDLLFKAVFGQETEESKYLLKEMLNAILHLEGDKRICELTHKNPFTIVESYTEKETIFDIKVVLDNKEQVDIEIQVNASAVFRKRSLFYWANLHSTQPLRGQEYEEVVKSICINIVNSTCIHESNQLHNIFKVLDNEEHFELCDDLEIHYFQLPNIYAIMNKGEFNDEEAWMLLIREAGRGNDKLIHTLIDKKEVLKMTYDAYNKINNDDLMREKLEAHHKYLMDKSNDLCEARREGEKVGLERGRIEIAKKMLVVGLSPEIIAASTGLSPEEIQKLVDSTFSDHF